MSQSAVETRRLTLAGIPTLLVEASGRSSAVGPLVVLYHGWHSAKEDHHFLATLMARQGYRVIMPDLYGHGERGPLDYDAPGVLEANFWPITLRSADEAAPLLTAAWRELGATPEQTAVAGVSMGGFVACAVFADNTQLGCLININGGLAWEQAELVFRGEDGRGLANDGLMAELAARDPIRRRQAIYPRPVLLVHGTADTVIAVAIERYAYETLAPLYAAAPERLALFEDPRSNHIVTLKMVERAFAWLTEYLPSGL